MDTTTPAGGQAGPDPTSIGTPPSPATPPAPTGFFAAVRRTGMFRGDDRWIGGVCDGLARRFGLDPLLVRGLFAASVLLGGLGLVAYGVAWALLPEQRDGRIHLEEMVAGRFDVALLGALGVLLVGLARGDQWFWFWDGPPGWLQGMLWVAFVVGLVALVVTAANRRSPRPVPVWTAPAAPGAPGTDPWVKQPAATGPAPRPTSPYGPPPVPRPTSPYAATPASPYASAPVGAPPAPGPYGPYRQGPPPVPPVPVPPHPPVPPVPPRPPKPRTLGPGVGTVGVVVALSLLGVAVLLLAERSGDFTGPVLLTALGIGVVLCGLGIVLSGLRGRRSGTLGFLAITGILVALPVGAAQNADWVWEDGSFRQLEASTYVVDSRDSAAAGFDLGFGDATLDLTSLPLDGTTLDVPVSIGAGNLTIVVPADAAVAADVKAGVGSVTWAVDGEERRTEGIGMADQTYRDEQSRDGSPQILLHVSVGAGDLRIEEDR
ncbi:PspC domain-containing protein [Cellulomonas fimi]|uniref:PspC domain protein n=1 Tax=Cellulomonas fimi (strain ATCC 484 / DSM 20113 / JCM 1341 / CCUG 24087 / LMG 16345 / NBRC 15513 / NCIMB 8980 / NCTC 7547 / NRS-133) TaxID=590998 RepID=F4H2L1_CELFA|nr:PspC domain-containing protein [Cellulomonas fimi]AEE45237.1 PspC domain protein [Cellulomonas fimi ATCC 484]NNH07097.1 PspC domain-containing protein [Cellulomonas fimi]VEH28668.1 Predicted membrane protein [Cellulomonas fimi]